MRRSVGILGALALVVLVSALYVGSALAETPTPTPNTTVPDTIIGNGPRAWAKVGPLGMGFGLGRNLMGHTLDRVAEKLGMTADDLMARLRNGDTLKAIAEEKNVSEGDLADHILAPVKDSLQVRVKYGQMTQEQADAALAQAKQALTKLMETSLNQVKQRVLGISSQTLARLADKLGMQLTDLQAALEKGDSLKTIAAGKNMSETDLVDFIVAPHQEQMAVRVKYGYLTQEQADQALQSLKAEVTRLVETPGDELRTSFGPRGRAGWQGMGRGHIGRGAGLDMGIGLAQ